MFCKKCGNQIEDNTQFCPFCGQSNFEPATAPAGVPVNSQTVKSRCLPSFILGLIGSILGMFGGLCTSLCKSAFLLDGDSAIIFIFGGSVIGLIGACLCLSKAKLGSILEAVGTVMIMINAFTQGAEFMSVFGFIFLGIGAVIGLIYAFAIDRK